MTLPSQGIARFGLRLIASLNRFQKKKEIKMAKRGRPKKVVEEKNSILSLIKKLIGTAKRKTFWDWLTGK
tara:strand:- start:1706 stop:1915 length:210 start_codon:yes stop_codon:yes gene_type:complete